MIEIDTLKFDEAGLIPAIIQDASTRVVLMGFNSCHNPRCFHPCGVDAGLHEP